MQFDLEKSDPVISIGTFAHKVGLSVSAIRKYESEGLILSHRTASGHRLFSWEDIHRVRHIHGLIQDLGLNIEGIRRLLALLPCWEIASCTSQQREECDAARDNTRPCWKGRGPGCASDGHKCRACPVYRFGSMSAEEIKSILHRESVAPDSSAAVRELKVRMKRCTE